MAIHPGLAAWDAPLSAFETTSLAQRRERSALDFFQQRQSPVLAEAVEELFRGLKS